MTDIPADTSTTAHINVGDTFVGSLETDGDHDWIAVDLVAGQKYTMTLDGYGSNALVDPYLYLKDASGTVLAENDDSDVVMIVTPHIVRSREITEEDLKPFYVGTSNNLGAATAPDPNEPRPRTVRQTTATTPRRWETDNLDLHGRSIEGRRPRRVSVQ